MVDFLSTIAANNFANGTGKPPNGGTPKFFENQREEAPHLDGVPASRQVVQGKPEHTRRKHLDGRRETVYL